MIVDLNRVAHIAVSGLKVELHFRDGGTHMRTFTSAEDMLQVMEDWRTKTAEMERRLDKESRTCAGSRAINPVAKRNTYDPLSDREHR